MAERTNKTAKNLIACIQDLAAAGGWFLQRVSVAEKALLIGLGSFGAASKVADELLKLAGTPEEAYRALLHVDLLIIKDSVFEKLDHPNLKALIFLLEAEIHGGCCRTGQQNLIRVRNSLVQIQELVSVGEE